MRSTEAPRPFRTLQGGIATRPLQLVAGILLTVSIFLIDAFTPLQGAIAVLYVIVLLLAANLLRRRGVLMVAALCAGLTIVGHLAIHGLSAPRSPVIRALVSLAAIGITTWLALRNQAVTLTLARQARILDLTHDTIFVQGMDGVISYWNHEAEALYGWTATEAIGQVTARLLRTVFPCGRDAAIVQLLRTEHWQGEILQTTRAGRQLPVACRWALQRDDLGHPAAIIETNTDVSEWRRAEAELARSEWRYRAIFEKNGVALLEQDWSAVKAALDGLREQGVTALAEYLAANPAFIRETRGMVRTTGLNAVAATLDMSLPETDGTFEQCLLAIDRGDQSYEAKTRIRSLQGHTLDIVFVITFPARTEAFTGVLVSLLDITEREATQRALLEAQRELAHTSRVATIGALTSSLAHEVNQPLAAITTNAGAALRWLRRPDPDIAEAESALERVARDGKRAAAIIGQARSFLGKEARPRAPIDLAETIREAVLLIEHELQRHRVSLRFDLACELPRILADRVELQQVMINLMLNGAQAMAQTAAPQRILGIRAGMQEDGEILVAVQDHGSGIAPELLPRLFEPFQTTRAEGMGLGLAICRSTVESYGGRLSASSDPGHGATFRFTLPAAAQVVA
jgi:PAS domain S-box-containing protein